MKRTIEIDLPSGYELDINVDRHKLPGHDSVLAIYGLTDDKGEVHISTVAFVVVRPE